MTGATGPGAAGRVLAGLALAGRELAEYRSGEGLEATLSPRPYLHPVRTLAGVEVSDAVPADHRWHLGVGVAIQDVGGVNCWGGRTYRRDTGYVWREDHGRVEHLRFVEQAPDGFVAELSWRGPDGGELLRERRELRAVPVAAAPGGWQLQLRFALRNVTAAALELGSPGSNGRPGGGYGGFFWRLPPLESAVVRSAERAGESEVHGRVSAWLGVQGRAARDAEGREVTLVFRAGDEASARDPWFVRLEGYPGLGSALAWTDPVPLAPGGELRRGFEVLLLDGAPDLAAAAAAWSRAAD